MTSLISSESLENTERLAAAVGSRLRGGEVIVLTSDLGGGKTAFVRGMARGMGSKDHVSSPTFTIGRQYNSTDNRLRLYHFDFYRLGDPGIVALELEEALGDPSAVIAIEWADVVENVLPAKRMTVGIQRTGETSRSFTFEYPPELAYLITEGTA